MKNRASATMHFILAAGGFSVNANVLRHFFICLACALALTALSQTKVIYENNFEKEEPGKVPADFMVLDGGFAVKAESGNKFLELPGAPLDSFAAQFGPQEVDSICVTARIKGTTRGRRYPTFGVGLNGVAGYKLQVSPAKGVLELFKDTEQKGAVPFEWKSGVWTRLRLQVRKTGDSQWHIEGKAWLEVSPEPGKWMIEVEEKTAPNSGRASVFGSPFSGTPIDFDDLVITSL